MLKIFHVHRTQFFEKFCTFNEHYYSNNLLNNGRSKYAISWRTLNLLCMSTIFLNNLHIRWALWFIQFIYFCTFTVCNLSRKTQNFARPTNTIFFLNFVHSTDTITQKIYISTICTKCAIFRIMLKLSHIQTPKYIYKNCTLNKHYDSYNSYNFVRSKYIIYLGMLKIWHV